jgi:uncharacterized protein with PQ loop repeat
MALTSGFYLELSGWIPAVIFPAATSVQLVKIIRAKTAEGISILTWTLFGLANVGLYVYAEKYFSFQAIIGLLGTAVLDFIIVGLAVFLNRKKYLKETGRTR